MTQATFRNTSKTGKRGARRQGATIVLMALTMTSLLGFGAIAVDYGIMVADANRMQRACDAAALAGATELCRTGSDATSIAADTARARALAVVVAARNKVTVNANDITFPTYNKIRVPASAAKASFFAAAIGNRGGTLNRFAQAGRLPLRGLYGASPLAITTTDYNNYKNGTPLEVLLIRNQDSAFTPGTAASLDLRLDNSGKSGAVFQDDLQFGYSGQTVLGQPINSALTADVGSQGSKMEIAFRARMDAAALAPYYDNGSNNTYPNYPVGDPRIITIMVADPSPANNNNPSLIARAFVNVYIEAIRSPANKNYYVRIRILPTVSYNSQDPRITVVDDGSPITGPSAVVLSG